MFFPVPQACTPTTARRLRAKPDVKAIFAGSTVGGGKLLFPLDYLINDIWLMKPGCFRWVCDMNLSF